MMNSLFSKITICARFITLEGQHPELMQGDRKSGGEGSGDRLRLPGIINGKKQALSVYYFSEDLSQDKKDEKRMMVDNVCDRQVGSSKQNHINYDEADENNYDNNCTLYEQDIGNQNYEEPVDVDDYTAERKGILTVVVEHISSIFGCIKRWFLKIFGW